jgi:hypothetical protein
MPIAPRKSARPERCVFERLTVDSPARLHDGSTVLEGRIENVNAMGLAFATSTMYPELPVGTRVRLVAPGSAEDGSDLQLHGRMLRSVEYCDGAGDSRSYAIGLDEQFEM